MKISPTPDAAYELCTIFAPDCQREEIYKFDSNNSIIDEPILFKPFNVSFDKRPGYEDFEGIKENEKENFNEEDMEAYPLRYVPTNFTFILRPTMRTIINEPVTVR